MYTLLLCPEDPNNMLGAALNTRYRMTDLQKMRFELKFLNKLGAFLDPNHYMQNIYYRFLRFSFPAINSVGLLIGRENQLLSRDQAMNCVSHKLPGY